MNSHIIEKRSNEELEYRTPFSGGGYAEKIIVRQSELLNNVAALHNNYKKISHANISKIA